MGSELFRTVGPDGATGVPCHSLHAARRPTLPPSSSRAASSREADAAIVFDYLDDAPCPHGLWELPHLREGERFVCHHCGQLLHRWAGRVRVYALPLVEGVEPLLLAEVLVGPRSRRSLRDLDNARRGVKGQ